VFASVENLDSRKASEGGAPAEGAETTSRSRHYEAKGSAPGLKDHLQEGVIRTVSASYGERIVTGTQGLARSWG